MEIKLSDRSKICGIYKILCISNKKFYLGSSLNVIKRLKDGQEKNLYNFQWAINYNIHRSMINNIKKGIAKTVLDGFNDRWKVLAVNK